MTKITLLDVASFQNDTTATTTVNNNSSTIQTAFDNTLSRDGTAPNQMEAILDMNSNRIVNLPSAISPDEPVRMGDLVDGTFTFNAIPVGGTTGQVLTKNSSTNYDVSWEAVVEPEQGRQQLTANTTWYVSASGSDSNNGTISSPFLTIQKAIDTAASIDLNGFNGTISVGAGTFAGFTLVDPVGPGSMTITGAGTSSTFISATSANAIAVGNTKKFTISGMAVSTTTSGDGINCISGTATFGAMAFGACAGNHISSNYNGYLKFTSNYTITGTAVSHWNAVGNATISAFGLTITLSNTPTFAGAFANVSSNSSILVYSNTFTGGTSGTSQYYAVNTNGIIYTNQTSQTYFPGNTAGTTQYGGQYA